MPNHTKEEKKAQQSPQQIQEDHDFPLPSIAQLKSLKDLETHQFDEKQNKHISTTRVYLHCITIAMGCLYNGYNVGVLNLAQKKLNYVYNLTDNLELYEGILSSSLLLGAIIGSFISGSLISKIGERGTSILCDKLGIFLLLLLAIPNYFLAVIVRFLLGFINGINDSTLSAYISQVTPLNLRGKTGACQSIFISSGVLLAYFMSLGFPTQDSKIRQKEDYYWRTVLLLPIILCLIRLTGLHFFFQHDTPQFYLKKSQEQKAIQSLQQIYKPQHIQEELNLIKNQYMNQDSTSETWKHQLSKENWPRLKLSLILHFLYNTSGLVAIMLYSGIIFEKATGDEQIAKQMSIATGIIQVITAFCSGVLSKRHGRRPLMLKGIIVQIVILISFGTVSYLSKDQVEENNVSFLSASMTIGLIFVFCIVFRLTSGTITWAYIAEIQKEKGCAIATGNHYFSAFLVALLFPILEKSLGVHSLFFIFAMIQILGMFYLVPTLRETKGMTFNQVKQAFLVPISQQSQLQYPQKHNNNKEVKNDHLDQNIHQTNVMDNHDHLTHHTDNNDHVITINNIPDFLGHLEHHHEVIQTKGILSENHIVIHEK